MIDLHTHSLFSDGELVPSELLRRMEVLGYEAVAITDHSDSSNIDFIVPRIVKVSREINGAQSVRLIPGIELTHVPPTLIKPLVCKARDLGAAIVVVHGETVVEPVAPGTNRAAIEAGADILAHPGLISLEEASLAAEKGVYLEISGRPGHAFANGHVARMAKEAGAKLIINSDAHGPRDILSKPLLERIAQGAGLGMNGLQELMANSRLLLKGIGGF